MRYIQKRALQGQKRLAHANVKPYPADIYAFALARANPLSHLFPGCCPGLCAHWAFSPPFRCHSKCRM